MKNIYENFISWKRSVLVISFWLGLVFSCIFLIAPLFLEGAIGNVIDFSEFGIIERVRMSIASFVGFFFLGSLINIICQVFSVFGLIVNTDKSKQ